jgi:hypothetical protein
MCASCGCGKPDDQHGDSSHITKQQIDQAAQAAGISAQQAAANIQDAVGSMSS